MAPEFQDPYRFFASVKEIFLCDAGRLISDHSQYCDRPNVYCLLEASNIRICVNVSRDSSVSSLPRLVDVHV